MTDGGPGRPTSVSRPFEPVPAGTPHTADADADADAGRPSSRRYCAPAHPNKHRIIGIAYYSGLPTHAQVTEYL